MTTKILGFVALVSLIAGCAALTTSQADVTILEGDPSALLVRVRNNGTSETPVSHSGFRIVDVDGLASEVDFMQAAYFQDTAFPMFLKLGAGEAAQGYISFGSYEGTGPYTLKYDYAGLKGETTLPQANGG